MKIPTVLALVLVYMLLLGSVTAQAFVTTTHGLEMPSTLEVADNPQLNLLTSEIRAFQLTSNVYSGLPTIEHDNQTVISDQDIETLLDNHPVVQELQVKHNRFFASFWRLKQTLDEIENFVHALENGFVDKDRLQLENFIEELELCTENFESEASELFQMLDSVENYPLLVAENGEATLEYGKGEIDIEFKLWQENLVQASYGLVDALRELQENIELSRITDVLECFAGVQELMGMVASEDTVVLEDVWFERAIGHLGDVPILWWRTTWAHQGDDIRVQVRLHNTDWLARGCTWLDWTWLGASGWLYWDLAANQTGTATLYTTKAPSYPGDYTLKVWGRWEAWTWFIVWIKVGEGTIPMQERTLTVVNRAPRSERHPVTPRRGLWGTTFTYSTEITDEDGHWVEVTLYKDGDPYGDSKWVHGSGPATWTWTSTQADIGYHNYYFMASDGYDTTSDPETGTYSGPTVIEEEWAALEVQVKNSSTNLAIQDVTVSIWNGGIAISGTTGADGWTVWPDGETTLYVPLGEYVVEVRHPDFYYQGMFLTVEGDVTKTFYISPKPPEIPPGPEETSLTLSILYCNPTPLVRWEVGLRAYLTYDSEPLEGKGEALKLRNKNISYDYPIFMRRSEATGKEGSLLISEGSGRYDLIFYADTPIYGELPTLLVPVGTYSVFFQGDGQYGACESNPVEIPPAGDSIPTALSVMSGKYTSFLNEAYTKDFWKINLDKHQAITISMTPGSDYDLHFYDPNQNTVASSTHRGEDLVETIIYTAEISGYHYIEVRRVSGEGIYSLEVEIIKDTIPPTSSVNAIDPYWRNSVPLTVTATASDPTLLGAPPPSGVDSVALWYRYSADNSVWGPWSEFAVDSEEPWGWEFDAPEGDGHYEFYSLAVDRAGNTERKGTVEIALELFFDDFNDATLGTNLGGGSGAMSPIADLMAQVQMVNFLFDTPPNAGTVYIDSVRFTNPTSILVLDDFNDGSPPNNLGGSSGTMDPDPIDPKEEISELYAPEAYEGSYALRLDYNRGVGSWVGYWSFMRPDQGAYDASAYRELRMWVRGVAGGERFRVELKDTEGNVRSVPITLVPGFEAGLTTGWRELVIPLDMFGGIRDPMIEFTPNVKEGSYALRISYNPRTWCGYYNFTRADRGAYDMSAYGELRMWVKGAVGGERFWIKLEDIGNNTREVPITLLSGFESGVTTDWQELAMPFEYFAGVDMTRLKMVNIIFKNSGTIYLDSIRFLREVLGVPSTEAAVGVDTLAPAVPDLMLPADGTITNDSTPTFNWEDVSDEGSPITYYLKINDEPSFSWPWDEYTTSDHQKTVELSDGKYYWLVVAKDDAGNWSAPSESRALLLDTVPPPAPAKSSPPDGLITNIPRQTFTWGPVSDQSGSLTGEVAGIAVYEIWIDDESDFSLPEIIENVAGTSYATTLADGNYYWRVRAWDRAGNAGPFEPPWTILVDILPPESSVDAIEPYWQESVPFGVSATAIDDLSGVASVELFYRSSIDDSTWSEWKSYGVANVAPYEWSFTAPDGYALYEFHSIATDAAGNVEAPPELADAACGVVTPATIDIDPDTLNLKSKGRWITAYIELPGGYDVNEIIISTVALEGDVLMEGILSAEPRPTEVGDHDHDSVPDLMVKFDRAAVQNLVSVGDVELTVIGRWSMVPFRGSDTIRVIEPGGPQGQGNGQGQGSGNGQGNSNGQNASGDQGQEMTNGRYKRDPYSFTCP